MRISPTTSVRQALLRHLANAVLPVAVAALACDAMATPITYYISGTVTNGSFTTAAGTVTLTNSLVEFTVVSDTSLVQPVTLPPATNPLGSFLQNPGPTTGATVTSAVLTVHLPDGTVQSANITPLSQISVTADLANGGVGIGTQVGPTYFALSGLSPLTEANLYTTTTAPIGGQVFICPDFDPFVSYTCAPQALMLTLIGGPNSGTAATFQAPKQVAIVSCDSGCAIPSQGYYAAVTQPTLFLSVGASGGGTIMAAPLGATCPAPPNNTTSCSYTISAQGQGILLSAMPAAGYTFAGWSGICQGSAPTCEAAITGVAPYATATFVPANQTSPAISTVSTQLGQTCVADASGSARCWGLNYANWVLKTGTRIAGTPLLVPGEASNVVSIAAGYGFACSLTNGGGVQCWGDNFNGGLGNGSAPGTFATTPVSVTGLSQGVAQIVAGESDACALTTSGAVQCWGANASGQLGNGTLTPSSVPVSVINLSSGATGISMGATHACALTASSSVMCWGDNQSGELGTGSTTNSTTPVPVSGIGSSVTGIAAGSFHTCALTSGGVVFCWGDNTFGELGSGSGSSSLIPVQVGGIGATVTQIAAASTHTCALTTLGTVMCWGNNGYGQLGNGAQQSSIVGSAVPVNVSNLSDAIAISATATQSCALRKSGAMVCWGDNTDGQLGNNSATLDFAFPVAVVGLGSYLTQVSAGLLHTCALTEGGGVQCWGDNPNGGLGNGTTTSSSTAVSVTGLNSGVVSVASGHEHTCALNSAGSVVCWGFNGYGQLGNGSQTDSAVPVPVSGLSSGVALIATGGNHSCAITTSGGLQCWGYNGFGQLGNGSTANSPAPVPVTGLSSGVVAVSGGDWHTCALSTLGGVQCWGYNNFGQLGTGPGSPVETNTPAPVTGLASGVLAIAAGSTHTCALTSAGAVQCWGANNYGQLGNGNNTASAAPVAVSGLGFGVVAISSTAYHSCALTYPGAVLCWGYNGNGQLGNSTLVNSSTPAQVTGLTSGVTAVSAGGGHTCAIDASGTAQCWGDNVDGELGNGNTTSVGTPTPIGPLATDNSLQFTFPPGPPAGPLQVAAGSSSLTLAASSSSQLGLQFSTLTPDVCSVGGSTVGFIAAGICKVQAAQSGNATVNPAPAQTREIVVSTLTPLQAQATPTLSSATAAAATQINLAWTEASNPAALPVTGFQVWRSTNGGAAVAIATAAGAASLSYVDSSVTPGNTYTYSVLSLNAAGSSPVSNALTVQMVVQTAPVLASVAIVAPNQVELTWTEAANALAPAVTGFQVWRSTNGAAAAQIGTVAGSTTLAYVDTTVTAGNSYDYTIVAVNVIGSSASSNSLAVPAMALTADGYTCQALDIPGSAWTQVWQLNDAGQIAADSNQGAFVYDSTTGQWSAVAAPPVSSGYTAADVNVLGINNHGQLAGVAQAPLSPVEQSFILNGLPPGGAYTFEPNFASSAAPGYSNTEFRALSDNGLVPGFASPPPYPPSQTIGFIYNPTAVTIATFPPGYTSFVPKLSDGSASTYTIPGAMNASGLFVGSGSSTTIAKEAFLYNPNTLTKYSLGMAGVQTALRGLNDLDPHSSTNCSSSNCLRAVGWARPKGLFVDFDPATGFQVPQIVDCSAGIPGAVATFLVGINNRNLVAGQWMDSAGNDHGLIAYPNVALPTTVQANGSFVFSVTVAANVPAFLDPPIAVGYSYATGAGDPKFGSVTLPIGVGGNHYTLLVQGRAFPLTAGKRFDFTANGFARGVSSFAVEGISPSAALSPSNTTAFVTEVTFVSSGKFTGTMTPMLAANEIAALLRAADDAPGPLGDDVERVARDDSAGNITAACSALSKFLLDVQSLTPAHLNASRAAYLTAQGTAIENALACP